jgi:alpha-glucosidase (family GH31 glycosyl hydrolase)
MFFASTGPQVFEVVKFYNSTKMVLNYITVGGALEFYVLIRGSAQDIISRYQGLVGMPMMPPYYALGVWHGSNIYASWTKVKSIYDNYAGAVN